MQQTNGDALKVIRERSGLSLRALSKLLDEQGVSIHHDSLRNIECGKRGAGPEIVKALATALKIPQTAILNYVEDEAAA